MAHLSFVVRSQLARRRDFFFNDDWCTGDVIKQKSHFFMVMWVGSLVLNNVQLSRRRISEWFRGKVNQVGILDFFL